MKLLLAFSLMVLLHAAPRSARNLLPPDTLRLPDAPSHTDNHDITDLLLPLLEQIDDHVHDTKKKQLLEITPLQNRKSKKTPLLILASEIPTNNIKHKFDFKDTTDYLQNNNANNKFNERLLRHTSGERINNETSKKRRKGDKKTNDNYNDSVEDVSKQLYKLKQHSDRIRKSNQLFSNKQGQTKLRKLNDKKNEFFDDYIDILENSGERGEFYHNNGKYKRFLGELVNNLPFATFGKNNDKVNLEKSTYREEKKKETVDGLLGKRSERSKIQDQNIEDRVKNIEKIIGHKKQDELNALIRNHDRTQSVELLNGQEKAEKYSFESKEDVSSKDASSEKKLILLNTNVGLKNKRDDSDENLVQLNEFRNNLSQKQSIEEEDSEDEQRISDNLGSDSLEVLKDASKLPSSDALNEHLLSSKLNRNRKLILEELVANGQEAVDRDTILPKIINVLKDDLSLTTLNVNSKYRTSEESVSEESREKKNSVESVGSIRNIDAVKGRVDAVSNKSMEGLLEVIDNIDQSKLTQTFSDKCDRVSRAGNEDGNGVSKVYNLSFKFRK